jgi:hypothetical protein
MIAENSGHWSIDALHAYEHALDEVERTPERSISGELEQEPSKKKESLKPEKEHSVPQPALPNFSAMNNCTINFNINYNK